MAFAVRPFRTSTSTLVEDEVRNIMGRMSVFSLDEGQALGGVGGYPIGYFV